MNLDAKEHRLREILLSKNSLLVAYSGGVDSTLLLAVAHDVWAPVAREFLRTRQVCHAPRWQAALRVAEERGIPVEVVATSEQEDPRYTENPPTAAIFARPSCLVAWRKLPAPRDSPPLPMGKTPMIRLTVRPGSRAAAEFSVLAPLRELDSPRRKYANSHARCRSPRPSLRAQPCLSSRIPHGTPVTKDALDFVEKGEEILRPVRISYLSRPLSSARSSCNPNAPGSKTSGGPRRATPSFSNKSENYEGAHGSGFGRV